MLSLEHNGREWIVTQDGNAVSVHPTREEAERAIEWLVKNHHRTTQTAPREAPTAELPNDAA